MLYTLADVLQKKLEGAARGGRVAALEASASKSF